MVDARVLKAITANVSRADIVAVGTVESIGDAPGVWSGFIATFQEVQYKEIQYLKIRLQDTQLQSIKVFHPVVAKSLTAEDNHPSLRKDLFVKGSRRIIFIQATGRLETFDENYGVLKAEPELLDATQVAVKNR